MVLELYPKIYEKMQKTSFRRSGIIPKTKQKFHSKIDRRNFQPIFTLWQNFESVFFELTEK